MEDLKILHDWITEDFYHIYCSSGVFSVLGLLLQPTDGRVRNELEDVLYDDPIHALLRFRFKGRLLYQLRWQNREGQLKPMFDGELVDKTPQLVLLQRAVRAWLKVYIRT